ncbi:hypothetical protein FPQ18DRAFT_310818 [Pyronema domesticum]|nr:hypothetical protein FPQ18DRAFT_310818 [Pyronema domesticum]
MSSKADHLAKELSDLRESLRNDIKKDRKRAESRAGPSPESRVGVRSESRAGPRSGNRANPPLPPHPTKTLSPDRPVYNRFYDCLVEYRTSWNRYYDLEAKIGKYQDAISMIAEEIDRLYHRRDLSIFRHFDIDTVTLEERLIEEEKAHESDTMNQCDSEKVEDKRHLSKMKEDITQLIKSIEALEDEESNLIDQMNRLRNNQLSLQDQIADLEGPKEELISEYFQSRKRLETIIEEDAPEE